MIPGPYGAEKAEKAQADLDLRMEPYEPVRSPDEEGALLLIYRDQTYRLTRRGRTCFRP